MLIEEGSLKAGLSTEAAARLGRGVALEKRPSRESRGRAPHELLSFAKGSPSKVRSPAHFTLLPSLPAPGGLQAVGLCAMMSSGKVH